MKKTVFLVLFAFLLIVLPVMAQADKLTGNWIGFLGPDYTMLRFSADGSLSVLDILDYHYTEYSGTFVAADGTIRFDRSDDVQDEMFYSFEDGKLHLEWNGELIYTRIADSFFPEDPEASPYMGENRKYRISMGDDGGIWIFEYFGDEETVSVPSSIFGLPVTGIDDFAFSFKEEMKHIILPDGIKSVGYHAFEENHDLVDVRLPDTLESIGEGAFQYCWKLKEIVIPEGIKTLGDGTFWQCSSLRNVVLPESLEDIHPEAFYGSEVTVFTVKQGSYAEKFCKENGWICRSLDDESWDGIYNTDGEELNDGEGTAAASDTELAGTWITFREEDIILFRFWPDGSKLSFINSYGYYPILYEGPWTADSETIVWSHPDEGFEDEIPYYFLDGKLYLEWDSTEYILDRIDDSLYPDDLESSPYFGENKEYWVSQLDDGTIRFGWYSGNDETVSVPDNVFGFPVTLIGGDAFGSNENLKHVVIPHGVKVISARAFSYCSSLESVDLPDTLEKIGYAAFEYCKELKQIAIPEGVTFLEADIFWGCENLTGVVLPASLEAIDDGGAFDYNTQNSILFTVKQDSFAEHYCRKNGLSYIALDDQNWKLVYTNYDADKAKLLLPADPKLTGSWLAIDEGDFFFIRFSSEGQQMEYLECASSSCEEYAGFYYTENGKIIFEVPHEQYPWELPFNFFEGKLLLELYGLRTYVRINDDDFPEDPEGSSFIGENKEYWASLLEDGTLRISAYTGTDEIVEVPGSAFGIPVTVIGNTAFSWHDTLRKVVLPLGITAIETQAFENCSNLETIVLPESLTEIDDDVFSGSNAGAAVFYVQPGSYAEQYCRAHGLTFVHPDEELPYQESAPETDAVSDAFDVPDKDEPRDISKEMPVTISEEDGNKALFEDAMTFYNDEMYYSARMAFIESEYGDWEKMAENCIQDMPSTGEIWRDRSQWLQDMKLTISVGQPQDTAMFVRIFKDNAPVSYLFINGSEPVTVWLPGNGYYSIKDGIGHTWYGMKEAFGADGIYETMTFDDSGTDKIYLQSGYEYTLSINVEVIDSTSDRVYSELEDWNSFVK